MSQETPTTPTATIERQQEELIDSTITQNVVFAAMLGGFLGTILMMPVLVGIPELLGLFVTGPITDFAGFALFFGLESTLTLGIVVFGIGGVVVLPLTFIVVGAFLPPGEPKYLRGVTFATLFWVGFAPAFWPPAGALVVASYLVFSLLGHWVYGLTLGYVLDRVAGIPQHEV
ncbi:DUF6789 family protein [Haloferax namakaokahaiae]|uniref:DUF6789 family protein n=1 Tax=Haloferax namakaokahaiae TaxID=1748331 RepID=A0ABD5ZE06_9EURY